jgi:hypothetical protein
MVQKRPSDGSSHKIFRAPPKKRRLAWEQRPLAFQCPESQGQKRRFFENEPIETQGQTERFLILFEKTSFAGDDWRFSEWGRLPVCPQLPPEHVGDRGSSALRIGTYKCDNHATETARPVPLHIHMRRLTTEFRRDLFEGAVKAVADAGFSPLIRNSISAIQRTLRLEQFPWPEARPKRGLASFVSPSGILEGEVFLGKSEDTVRYLKVENITEKSDAKGTSTFVSLSWRPYLEAGAITLSEDPAAFEELCAVILRFAEEKISGSNGSARFESLVWTNAKLKELRSTASIAPYQFSGEDKRLASELRFRPLRNLALTVKASGGMLIKDVRLAARREGSEDLADRLTALGLAQREFVVICKRSSQQIIRFREPEMIANLEKQGVLCSCGRHLKDENVEEILTPSDAIKTLLDGGKWLGAVLLSELENLGIRTVSRARKR